MPAPLRAETPAEPTGRSDLAAFVARHQVALWRYLRALGARHDEAEDLLQDALLVAMRRLDEPGDDAVLATFLRRTARHLFLRRRRDDARREARVAEACERQWRELGLDRDGGDAWLDALRACTEALPERAGDVVRRFYRDGLSRADIGSALGMRETGVKTLLQRVRHTLRACVERRLGARATDDEETRR